MVPGGGGVSDEMSSGGVKMCQATCSSAAVCHDCSCPSKVTETLTETQRPLLSIIHQYPFLQPRPPMHAAKHPQTER